MKKKVLIFITIALILLLGFSGCKSISQKDYPVIPVSVNTELGCVELNYNGIIYRPYGVVGSSKLRGEQVGVREDADNGIVCKVKGYEASEWLIDYLDVFMGGGDTLYKAVGVTETPTELEQYQEYEF